MNMKFEDLNLIEPILKALELKNYTEPTEIQAKAIPLILDKKDVMGCAQTGTGKTAAFAIPIIQLLFENEEEVNARRPDIGALIVTPTRELAIQIDENIREYRKNTKMRHTVIYGGVKPYKQIEKLELGTHILVATPGRLLDLHNQGYVDLSKIKIFVLDEADRMLDMGFVHDIKRILKIIPEKRQTLFFSATMPDSITGLANRIQNNPVRVEVARVSSAATTIRQFVYYTNKNTKQDVLSHILNNKRIKQVLVFTRTKRGADRITRKLYQRGFRAQAIHGDKQQNYRQRVLKQFKEGRLRVLVATDIAARGIDISKLQYVINYDIPEVPETYVHRIGRSGRAGETGIALSICEPEENILMKGIEKLINQKVKPIQKNPYPQTDKPMTAAERKEWNKEKQRRKEEFFKNRKTNRAKNHRR